MNNVLHVFNPLSAAWGVALLRASVAGGVVLLLAGLLSVTWSRMPATGRSWLWRLVFCKLLFSLFWGASVRLPLLPASAPISEAPVTTPQVAAQPDAPRTLTAGSLHHATLQPVIEEPPSAPSPATFSPSASFKAPAPSANQAAPIGTAQAAFQATPQAVNRPRMTLSTMVSLLMLLWLWGVASGVIRMVRAWRVTQEMRSRCVTVKNDTVENAALLTLLADLRPQLGLSRSPQLLTGSHIDVPALTGIAHPAILLPQNITQPDEARMILAHELAHQARHDLLWNWLLWLGQTLFFFHPAVWWGAREWQRANEMACDSMAVRASGTPVAAYGAMLLRLALAPPQKTDLFSVGVNERYVSLSQRLKALQHAVKPERRWMAAIPLVLGILALVPWGLRARARGDQAPTGVATLAPATPRNARNDADAQSPATLGPLQGRLIGVDRQPIVGATVYVMRPYSNGTRPIIQLKTDADGHFQVTQVQVSAGQGPRDLPVAQLLADGGPRGFVHFDWFYTHPTQPVRMQLPATTTLQATFVDANNRLVAGVGVHLGQLRQGEGYWLALPPSILSRFRGRTDNKGCLTLPNLPQGWQARLVLDDEHGPSSSSGVEALRGGRFAPLAEENVVALDAPLKQCTIQLSPPVALQGRVTYAGLGGPVSNTRVQLRRLNHPKIREARIGGDGDIFMTHTDAQGKYDFSGLHPGNYVLEVRPFKNVIRDWMNAPQQIQLRVGKPNSQDIALAKSAVIEGRVVSAQTGRPVAGQSIKLSDAQSFYQRATSQQDGKFRFRAIGGKQRISLFNPGASPAKGFALPVINEFDLSVPSGTTYFLTLRLPSAPIITARPPKPIRGRVVDEIGQPVAGAQVIVEGIDNPALQRGAASDGIVANLRTDAEGRFILPAKQTSRVVQLWAKSGTQGTTRATFALSGDQVTLRLQQNADVTFEGRITDADGQPLSGIPVKLYRTYNNCGYPSGSTQTDADGHYTFAGQRPNVAYMIHPQGVRLFGTDTLIATQPGQHLTVNLKSERADSFIAGQLLDENGSPASGYNIWAAGVSDSVDTDGSGRFRIPHTKSGTIVMTASSPNLTNEFRVVAGRSDLVLHLSRTQNHAERYAFDPTREQRLRALIGKQAPAFVVSDWVNSTPLSLRTLREKVVLLNFFGVTDRQIRNLPELNAIHTQFGARGVQVVGIAPPQNISARPLSAGTLQTRLQNVGVTYPVAVDTAGAEFSGHSSRPTGATIRSYETASLVVLDTQGRIAYAGNSLSGAMSIIGSLIQ